MSGNARGRDGVMLLHGILRRSTSMARLEQALRESGYRTLNVDYPSRTSDIATLALCVDDEIARWDDGLGRLHVVTHSMGGLVARALIARRRPSNLGRMVMLGPPNHGSEIADLLGATRLYRYAFGPAGAQLRTDDPAMAALLGPVDFELGIIAGTRAIDPFGWTVLPRPNDGRVSVAATKVEGMRDHLVLPVTHAFMMRNRAVIRACIAFLRDGRFPR